MKVRPTAAQVGDWGVSKAERFRGLCPLSPYSSLLLEAAHQTEGMVLWLLWLELWRGGEDVGERSLMQLQLNRRVSGCQGVSDSNPGAELAKIEQVLNSKDRMLEQSLIENIKSKKGYKLNWPSLMIFAKDIYTYTWQAKMAIVSISWHIWEKILAMMSWWPQSLGKDLWRLYQCSYIDDNNDVDDDNDVNYRPEFEITPLITTRIMLIIREQRDREWVRVSPVLVDPGGAGSCFKFIVLLYSLKFIVYSWLYWWWWWWW